MTISLLSYWLKGQQLLTAATDCKLTLRVKIIYFILIVLFQSIGTLRLDIFKLNQKSVGVGYLQDI